jgi:hypothetical protein
MLQVTLQIGVSMRRVKKHHIADVKVSLMLRASEVILPQ